MAAVIPGAVIPGGQQGVCVVGGLVTPGANSGAVSWGRVRREPGLSLAVTATCSRNGLGDSNIPLSGGWGTRAVAHTDVLVDD